MCVCVCVRVRALVNVYINVYTYTYKYTYTYIYISICQTTSYYLCCCYVSVCVSVCVCACVCVCMYMRMFVCVCIHAYVCACVYKCRAPARAQRTTDLQDTQHTTAPSAQHAALQATHNTPQRSHPALYAPSKFQTLYARLHILRCTEDGCGGGRGGQGSLRIVRCRV